MRARHERPRHRLEQAPRRERAADRAEPAARGRERGAAPLARRADEGDRGDAVEAADAQHFLHQVGLTRHVAAGVSLRLSRRIFAVAEARRVWSQPVANSSFDFGDIDLGGLHMTGGIEFVF